MLNFLFFIIIFVLIIGLIAFSLVVGFIRSIFSFGKRKNPIHEQTSQDFNQPAPKQKIFEKEEGEYVDFEEIKD